ncbi:MAG: DNA repair exonuclease [Calditrichia bacterium]
MALKILHTADLHLGMKFIRGYPPDVQEKLVKARAETLHRLVEVANKNNCDLLVIAGDLFDSQRINKTEILEAAQIIGRFNGAAALVLPGNHDYLQSGDSRLWDTFRQNMAENCLLLADTRALDLRPHGVDAAVYPAPCSTKHSSENMLGWLDHAVRDPEIRHHFGVAHGSLQGISPDFNSDYFPMNEAELLEKGLDFWLLGHTHIRLPLQESGSGARIFMPATPEPDGFDCGHSGSAWLLQADDEGKLSYQAVSSGRYRFLRIQAELNSAEDAGKLLAEFKILKRETHLVKLQLKGRASGDVFDGLDSLLKQLQQQVLYLETDASGLLRKISAEDIGREFTEGSFPFRLLNRLQEEGRNPLSLQMAYDLVREAKS